jgi:hypothetical protein
MMCADRPLKGWLVALVAPGAADIPPASLAPGQHKGFIQTQIAFARAYPCPALDSGPVNAHTKPATIDAVCGETRRWITGRIWLMSTDI